MPAKTRRWTNLRLFNGYGRLWKTALNDPAKNLDENLGKSGNCGLSELLNTLNDHGDSLSSPDTSRSKSVSSTATVKLV